MAGVALVFPYFRTRAPTEMLFPPLGAATLAAQLRRLGVETRVFDCTFGSMERLRADLAAYDPDIVGIYSMVSLTRNTLAVAELVSASLPGSLLVAGGPLPTVFPGRYAQHFDAVFRGEADLSFPRFCRDYLARAATASTMARLPLDGYDGLFVPNHGLHDRQPDRPPPARASSPSFPLPDRSDFDHAAYQEVWLREDGVEDHLDHRHAGLPYGCDFCSKPIFGNVVRRRDSRRRLRRDRPDPRARLRQPVDRRRHLHARRRLPGGVLPAHGRPADAAGPASRAPTASSR